jgi:hypothetical protein
MNGTTRATPAFNHAVTLEIETGFDDRLEVDVWEGSDGTLRLTVERNDQYTHIAPHDVPSSGWLVGSRSDSGIADVTKAKTRAELLRKLLATSRTDTWCSRPRFDEDAVYLAGALHAALLAA